MCLKIQKLQPAHRQRESAAFAPLVRRNGQETNCGWLTDNKPTHIALSIWHFLAESNIAIGMLEQSPYSPDLAPYVSPPLQKHKVVFKATRFEDVGNIPYRWLWQCSCGGSCKNPSRSAGRCGRECWESVFHSRGSSSMVNLVLCRLGFEIYYWWDQFGNFSHTPLSVFLHIMYTHTVYTICFTVYTHLNIYTHTHTYMLFLFLHYNALKGNTV